ncbi:MAG: hypothetical protein ACJAYU_003127 [Bradymonadia bacterium]
MLRSQSGKLLPERDVGDDEVRARSAYGDEGANKDRVWARGRSRASARRIVVSMRVAGRYLPHVFGPPPA